MYRACRPSADRNVQVEPRGGRVESALRAAAPRQRRERAGLGAVDRLASRAHEGRRSAAGARRSPPGTPPRPSARRSAGSCRPSTRCRRDCAPGSRVDLKSLSARLNPQFRFIVMQVSQSDAGHARGGNLLLGRAEVARRPSADAVVDDDRRLQLRGRSRRARARARRSTCLPTGRRTRARRPGRSSVSSSFSCAFHERDVAIEVRAGLRARRGFPLAPRQVVGMMPVHDRVVEAQPDAAAPARIGQLPDDVAAVRRGHHVPRRAPSNRTARSRRGASW